MAQTQGQRRASLAVAAWLAHEERNVAWLTRQTGSDPGTLGDFLNGNRWPKFATQGRIEKALSWPAGTLTAIADGGEPPEVGADVGAADEDQDPDEISLRYRRPDGISDEEWARVKERTRGIIEWELDRAARER